MNEKIIISTLACLVLGSAVAITGCGQKRSKAEGDKNNTARAVVERKSKVSLLTSKISKLEIDNDRLKKQRDAAKAEAQMTRVKPLISPGDIIRQVNQTRVKDEKNFKAAMAEAASRESILLLVQRGQNGYYITLEP